MPEELDDKPLLPKPAFLKRVRIKNYKSIAYCDVTLEPLTIFVGRNGTGKSNFLDALGFLADLMDKSIYGAARDRGGWASISSAFRASDTISIEVELCLNDDSNHHLEATYAIDLTKQADASIGVSREVIRVVDATSSQEIGFTWDGKELLLTGNVAVSTSVAQANGKLTHWYLAGSSEKVNLQAMSSLSPFGRIYTSLKASGTFNFLPALMRQIQPITGPSSLEHTGRNLADVLVRLESHDRDWYARMMRYLNFIVPNVVNAKQVVLSGIGGLNAPFETIEFEVEIRPGRTTSFYASNVSDGTLRVLASLAAVYQHVSAWKPAGFIGIEEPETAIHPAAVWGLLEAFDEATLSTQILLTTHSPEVLDAPSVKPSAIRVVEMIDGKTVITPLAEHTLSYLETNTRTVGELLRSNNLHIDTEALSPQKNTSSEVVAS